MLVPRDPRSIGGLSSHLETFGDRPCLRDTGEWWSAQAVADAIRRRRRAFGRGRRLVCLEPTPTVDRVVDYLAAVDAGHVVLLASSDALGTLVDAWDPDTVVDVGGIDLRRASPAHRLHPDLALLLSTSGSTGNPKLVRLSHRNLVANARSIADYLGLRSSDRGITSLPLHYCYGLSVLHSHLAVGASVQLTNSSVVDPCFWHEVEAQQVTNLAGVPHTFDLIDRSGVDRLAVPSLRIVTQAGGRMAPERVSHVASTGRANGWELVVMYGQTEATARMAYLPPEFRDDHPDAVGVPVPGGSFEIRCPDSGQPVPTGRTGQVVYRGPNVMMGYATESAHLARSSECDELVTGDLGAIDGHGLLRIVGRESRFAKLFGLRIDLERIERRFAERGMVALAASDDERMAIVIEGDGDDDVDVSSLAALVADWTGLPANVITVATVSEVPRFSSGKANPKAALELAPSRSIESAVLTRRRRSIADEFRLVLGVQDIEPSDSFVGLGGDSFSYVELSTRLEECIGRLPDGWHLRPIAELEALAEHAAPSPWFARTDTTVVLRAVAIMLVVSSHMHFFYVPVGSHVLLAVAGFNFARFQLADTSRPGWWTSVASTFGTIAAIASAWILSQMLLVGGHSLGTLFLVNSYAGDPSFTDWRWRYWYIEATVHIGIALLALFAWRRARELERRSPFWFPMALLVPALMLRFEWVVLGADTRNAIFQADTVVWLFLVGWVTQRATMWWQRLLVTAILLATVPGYFWHDDRSMRLLVGLLVLAWIPWVPVVRPLHRVVGWLASASLAIYLTHYLVFPELDDHLADVWVFPLTLAIGVCCWVVARVAWGAARRRWAERDRRVADVDTGRQRELVPG